MRWWMIPVGALVLGGVVFLYPLIAMARRFGVGRRFRP